MFCWPCWLNSHDSSPATIERAVELGCAGVSIEWHVLGRATIRAAEAVGLDLAAFTVSRRSTYARLVEFGLAAICVEGVALEG